MKKTAILMIIICLLFNSCSVQENVNPQILIERIIKSDENVVVHNSFYDEESFVCYVKHKNSDFIFKFETDENENVKKINLACLDTDKVNDFIDFVQTVIGVYSPDDNRAEISENLFDERKMNDECLYYESQWHSYSAVLSEKGLYFSVSSKKLMPESEIEFSLKPNDIVEY